MRSIVRAAAFVLMLPTVVTAQTWRELYDRAEYEKAAALLHPLWMDTMQKAPEGIDIELTEALGQLYLEGRGVAADVLLACSFFELAVAEASFRHADQRHPVVLRTTQRRDQACGTLAPEARRDAAASLGCPRFCTDVYTFALGPARQVQIDRHSVRIQHGDHRGEEAAAIPCGSRLALVRHTRMEGDAAKALVERDLLEVFVWTPGKKPGHRTLQWHLSEIVDAKLANGDGAELGERPGGTWEQSEIPAEMLAVTFARLKDGEISWRFALAPFEGTLPALDVEIAPEASGDPPALPSSGDERLDVQVLDGFGAALAGVDVKLEGVIARSARTDQFGVATFDRLPRGRYDVVASTKGFASTNPRVLDLPQTQERVTLKLKPFAPAAVASIACGMVARTLESLGQTTDVVLHVRVEGQKALESDGSAGIVTTSRARVLTAFKSANSSPAEITIAQPGGTIDRGDVIQAHFSGNLPPLNVGDEYVVFLRREESGKFVLAQLEHGVFRIRNGRVYPSGSDRIAAAWKGRSAARFFDALRARVR